MSVSSGDSSSGTPSDAAVLACDVSRAPDCARTYTPLRYPGHPGTRFQIQLSYPDGEHPTHLYSVFHGMPVSGLRYNISCLLRVDSLVFLFVGPSWDALDHRGAITDRCLPGTHQPCPFLVDGSNVRVRCTRFSSPNVVSLVPSSVLIAGIASSPAPLLGGTDSFSRLFTPLVPLLAASSLPLDSVLVGPALATSQNAALPLAEDDPILSNSVSLISGHADEASSGPLLLIGGLVKRLT
jgi:hypothetical protein